MSIYSKAKVGELASKVAQRFNPDSGIKVGSGVAHNYLISLAEAPMAGGMLSSGIITGGVSGLGGALGGSLLGAAYGGVSSDMSWGEGARAGAFLGGGVGALGGGAWGAKKAWDIKPQANRYTRAYITGKAAGVINKEDLNSYDSGFFDNAAMDPFSRDGEFILSNGMERGWHYPGRIREDNNIHPDYNKVMMSHPGISDYLTLGGI